MIIMKSYFILFCVSILCVAHAEINIRSIIESEELLQPLENDGNLDETNIGRIFSHGRPGNGLLPKPRTGDWVKNAQLFGAFLFQLEHRYFGQSHPTLDASTSNLQWLTTEQALADLAAFITFIKAGNPQLRNAKVVVFGGSYPGNLAAWFRLKYPEIAAGAIASSAPVLAKVDFSEYLEVVGESLTAIGGSTCYANVASAFSSIRSAIASGNTQSFTQLFRYRGWLYMVCTEFGYMQTTDSSQQPFGSPEPLGIIHILRDHLKHHLSKFIIYPSFRRKGGNFEQLCQELFGVNPAGITSGVARTNTNYGGRQLTATNVVLPNGSIDPWHALGILKNLGNTTLSEYYTGGSHCYDMQSSNQYDNAGVKQVRRVITQQISNYLGILRTTTTVPSSTQKIGAPSFFAQTAVLCCLVIVYYG